MRPELINPLALAYLGDGVFEVYVREYLIVDQEITKPDLLQKAAIQFVSAKAQAAFMKEAMLHEWVDEDEIRIYKRGRNAKSFTMAKHATMADYRTATGMEALVGWLFLEERFERLAELISLGLEKIGAFEEI